MHDDEIHYLEILPRLPKCAQLRCPLLKSNYLERNVKFVPHLLLPQRDTTGFMSFSCYSKRCSQDIHLHALTPSSGSIYTCRPNVPPAAPGGRAPWPTVSDFLYTAGGLSRSIIPRANLTVSLGSDACKSIKPAGKAYSDRVPYRVPWKS